MSGAGKYIGEYSNARFVYITVRSIAVRVDGHGTKVEVVEGGSADRKDILVDRVLTIYIAEAGRSEGARG